MIQNVFRFRSIQRIIHLLFAVVLGGYIYSSLSDVRVVALLVQGVVFPGLALSGVLLWKGDRLRRWYRDRKETRDH